MSINWSRLQLFGGPDQILPHQFERPFDTLMIGGTAMRTFARSLQITYLNNLTHSPPLFRILQPFGHYRPARLANFLAGAALHLERFVAAVSKPSNLAGNSVQDIKLTRLEPRPPDNST